MGEQVQRFLEFTDEGSKFVFGEEGFEMHPVAFKVQYQLAILTNSLTVQNVFPRFKSDTRLSNNLCIKEHNKR